MCLYIVLQLNLQNVAYLFLQPLILDREGDLYPLVQIARHPVRTSHIEFFLAAVAEIENAGMLQKVSY